MYLVSVRLWGVFIYPEINTPHNPWRLKMCKMSLQGHPLYHPSPENLRCFEWKPLFTKGRMVEGVPVRIRKGGEISGYITKRGRYFGGRPLFEKGARFRGDPYLGDIWGEQKGEWPRHGHPNPKLDLDLRGPYLKVGQHHHPGSYGESKTMQ